MDYSQIVALVNKSGIGCSPGTSQKQWHQVRFSESKSNHSLNLGYSLPKEVFVADFVFKGETRDVNMRRCQDFISRFGGECRSKTTIFARLEVSLDNEEQLVNVIQSYWDINI